MRLLAIDPGKATGLALYRDVWRPVDGATAELLPEWAAWAEPWYESMNSVVTWVRGGELDAVCCENFLITRATITKGADAHWPMGGIGIARWICQREEVPFTLQSPADAKGFSTNDKLRHLGWKTPGRDHPDDATRHLLLYLARTGAINPRRLVVP